MPVELNGIAILRSHELHQETLQWRDTNRHILTKVILSYHRDLPGYSA